MPMFAARRPFKPARHLLWLGVAISLLLHGVVLALHGAAPAPPRVRPDILQIAIVNAHTEQAPDKPQIKAQMQVAGGGNAEQGVATSPLPLTGQAADTVMLQALRKRQGDLEEQQRNLLSVLTAQTRTAANQSAPGQTRDKADTPAQDDVDQPAVLANAQVAALSDRVQAYNRLPRKQFVAPEATSAVEAAYVEAWRAKIEATGTRFYPEQSGSKLYGSLRMTVSIRADGSVADLEIDQPSTEATLNQAARRIVQLAAPFPPFPAELARGTDILAITRTWRFVNDTLETRSP
jgi:protein TonB